MGMELFILSLHPYGRNILVSKSWFGEPSERLSFPVIGNSVLPELGNLAHSIAGSEVTNPRNVHEFVADAMSRVCLGLNADDGTCKCGDFHQWDFHTPQRISVRSA